MTRTTNARLAGFTFLFYIAVGITQLVLSSGTASAEGPAARLALIARHAPQIKITILLSLVICVTALTLAAALYGLTRDVDRELAVLALSFRVGEGILAALGTLGTLGLLWLATGGAGRGGSDAAAANALASFLMEVRGWNTTLTATLFAVGSALFAWLLVRGQRIPAPLAWLGVAASLLLVVGLPLQLVDALDASVVQLLWIPMALFEIPLGFWFLIKGAGDPPQRQAV